jgi:hypothetical protein
MNNLPATIYGKDEKGYFSLQQDHAKIMRKLMMDIHSMLADAAQDYFKKQEKVEDLF